MSQKVRAHRILDPEELAGVIFIIVGTFPASPLEQLLSFEEMQQL